jgi:hypothetical protein
VRKVACAAAALLVLAGCGDKERPATPVSSVEKGGHEGRIDEWILQDYEDESLIHGSDPQDPKRGMFSSKVATINAQKIDAAKKALDSGCSRVESVLFNRRESSLDNLVYLVHCSGGKRMTISSKDMRSSGVLLSDDEKAIGEPAAKKQCKALVTQNATHPESVNFHDIVGSSYYKAPNSGNVRVVMDFDAANSLGSKLEYRATCIFDVSGQSEVTIAKR